MKTYLQPAPDNGKPAPAPDETTGQPQNEPTPPAHEGDCWEQGTDDPCQQNLEVA